jgi:hypothetical protein
MSVLGIFLLPVLAFANPPMEAAKNKNKMREIGLNDQQIEKVQELKFKADRERIDIRSELDKAHLDMQQLLSVDKPNEAAVFTQIEKIGAIETRLKKNLFGSMLEARKLMTPEQWEKIEMIWAEEHGKDHRMHGERGDEMQSPAGPALKAGPAPKERPARTAPTPPPPAQAR